MFDLQTTLKNAMAATRAEQLQDSPQLTLGEIILKLQAVSDKTLPVVFDDEQYKPSSVGSWRGSYCELYIGFEEGDGNGFYEGDSLNYENFISTGMRNPSAGEFLAMLEKCKGKTFEGYKGGDFVMGKNTPVWVSSYGNSAGYKSDGDKYHQIVVDVAERDGKVVIETVASDYC